MVNHSIGEWWLIILSIFFCDGMANFAMRVDDYEQDPGKNDLKDGI